MNLLYIAFKDFSNLHFGANSKVLSQCKAFKEYGYEVDLIARQGTNVVKISTDGDVEIISEKKNLFHNAKLKNLFSKYYQMKEIRKYVLDKKFDVCYIRYDFSDSKFIKMLSSIKKSCKKVILELPTYPYESENSIGLLNKLKMRIDRHYRKRLNKYIDFIVTFYDGYKELFGIPVLVIPNGFDFSSMQLVCTKLEPKEIHIIAVSSMREWHGYERFIEGLKIYYSFNSKQKENIILHLVGNGREYLKYKRLVENYNLEDHVILEGALHGKELNDLYEICGLGIDSLARHRSGISVLSSLKSREYGAKGIPIINSCKIDIIGKDFDYMLEVPANEEPIDIEEVVDFYKKCYDGQDRIEVAKKIRKYIEEKTNMKATLKKVVLEVEK